MRGRFVFCPPQSVDRRGFLRDALAQTSELGGVTTDKLIIHCPVILAQTSELGGVTTRDSLGARRGLLAQTSELGGVTTKS